ncbi:MAG: chemotaxis-specific protein-glutamate methyltransferase CheB, partial [Acidobacteria bacterium]|nr:chemotaxis-specific protein-glutamate methyltransferase CheB [Acidobacteriota bacterium]
FRVDHRDEPQAGNRALGEQHRVSKGLFLSSPTIKPLRVAVVDDSSFVRRAIARMLEGDPRVEIVGLASSGEQLLMSLEEWQPEVITLDLSMPGMGGLSTLDRIMARGPIPVIILSTHSAKDAPATIEALHRGAMDFIDKTQYSLVDFQALREVILEKLLSVRTVSLPESETAARTASAHRAPARSRGPREKPRPARPPRTSGRFEALLIGASTGGPPTVQRLLEELAAPPAVPVVVVQHMPLGFTRAFAERLNAYLPLHVREAQDREVLEPATVYIAPAGRHLALEKVDDRLLGRLLEEPRDARHRPSVDVLFGSGARILGSRVLAVLLTGMGTDGATGMLEVARAGGYTVAQDAASCVVYGMPKAAKLLGAVREEVALDQLGDRITKLLS